MPAESAFVRDIALVFVAALAGGALAQALRQRRLAKEAAAGHFTFLNRALTCANGTVEWKPPAMSRLWQYHLHYAEYVPALALLARAGHTELALKVAPTIPFAPRMAQVLVFSAGEPRERFCWRVTPAYRELAAGAVEFNASNLGEDDHDFSVRDADGDNLKTVALAPGQSASVRVTLAAGVYRLYCSLPDHEAAGMRANVTIR